jgi:transcriptional regulator with XRE-family HTH domain
MSLEFKKPDELQKELGSRIRNLRIRQAVTQREVADKANVALRAVMSLESGTGSTVSTLVRVLKALNAENGIDALAPTIRVSPMSLLKSANNQPKRVRHPKTQ